MDRHALFVGIDRYPGFPEHNQLSSCVGDARLMAEVLQGRFGFPSSNVSLLTDEAATREGILGALEGLARRARSGDVALFYYSGHGSENHDVEAGTDRNLWLDESVEWEQTLVPHDSGRDGRLPVRDIRDDELYRWILELHRKEAFVIAILDSCHAGTAVRGEARIKRVPPIESGARRNRADPGEKRFRDATPGGRLPVDRRYTLLAACHHTENAKEYAIPDGGGLKHGAFTWFLVRELRRLTTGATYRDVIEAVRCGVTAVYPTQTPQVEGSRDRVVFGVERIEPQRFLSVRGRDDLRVELAGGAAHGLTRGSEWAIFPPATRRFDDLGAALGQARVITVRAVTSDAEIVGSAKGAHEPAITAGCRAAETSHHEDLCMPVAIRAQHPKGETATRLAKLVAALEGRIGKSDLLRVAADGESPQVVVHALTPRHEVHVDDPAPDAGPLAETTWALSGADGLLLRTAFPLFEPQSVQRVVANLETRARFLQVENLVDREPENPLRGTVRLGLLRRTPEGSWEPADAEEEGEPTFEVGDALGIELRHGFERSLFLHVFDLGLTGGVSLLHPAAGVSQAQDTGRVVRIGVREGEEMTVGLPAEYPRSEGREWIKVLATTHEADLTWLVEKRYRDAGRRSVLERRLGAAFRGGAFREAVFDEGPEDEQWTVVTRSFRVRR